MTYPDGAWYTYDDQTCEYECMAIEYIYWGVATYLGYIDHTGFSLNLFQAYHQSDKSTSATSLKILGPCRDVRAEWKICDKTQLLATDPSAGFQTS